jgi:hypothetical protein
MKKMIEDCSVFGSSSGNVRVRGMSESAPAVVES